MKILWNSLKLPDMAAFLLNKLIKDSASSSFDRDGDFAIRRLKLKISG